jgi:hypothetical protein
MVATVVFLSHSVEFADEAGDKLEEIIDEFFRAQSSVSSSMTVAVTR